MLEKEIIETGLEVVKDLAKDIYTDGAQPATRQVGKALETVCGLANTILLPIEYANRFFGYKLEEFISDLKNKTKKIPEEKLIEPSLRISGPVLEGLKYTDTPELREMFLNLLSSAMNIDTEAKTHPSFVETIKQLSSLDAKVFDKLVKLNQVACTFLKIMINDTNQCYTDAFPTFFVEELHSLADPFLISSSIKNLIRLGLIEHHDKTINGYDYDKFRSVPYVMERLELFANFSEKINLVIDGQAIGLNDYGKSFAQMCLKP
jgi:hypothetical protein